MLFLLSGIGSGLIGAVVSFLGNYINNNRNLKAHKESEEKKHNESLFFNYYIDKNERLQKSVVDYITYSKQLYAENVIKNNEKIKEDIETFPELELESAKKIYKLTLGRQKARSQVWMYIYKTDEKTAKDILKSMLVIDKLIDSDENVNDECNHLILLTRKLMEEKVRELKIEK